MRNAGVSGCGKAGEVTDEEWQKIISIGLTGVFNMTRAAIPHLVDSGGRIVNTASISGLRGDSAMAPYDAAQGESSIARGPPLSTTGTMGFA